jgi:hypothetical protein
MIRSDRLRRNSINLKLSQRWRWAFALLLVSLAVFAALTTRHKTLPGQATHDPPNLSATFVGPAQPVFDSRQGCEDLDIPDQPPRAFRDDQSHVHLIASHYVVRAMVGPTLDTVKHDCRVIYRSPEDPDPSHFQHRNWLTSFYGVQGRGIAVLVHSEYEADKVPGMCATPHDTNSCWWNTVTFASSEDNGYTFHVPEPPRNLVASLPYPYVIGNRASAYGYESPTNILKVNDFYYAMLNDWPFKAQQYGPCLIRTADVFDPGSWRAWNGSDFKVRFINPYWETNVRAEEHVCPPVFSGEADSLVRHEPTGYFMVTQYAPDNRFGPPGFYLSTSADLIHWSEAVLIAKTSELLAQEGPGNWYYAYFSLIDPASSDRNFSTITNMPYVYYVRFEKNDPPYTRVLFRRQIKIEFSKKPAP